MNIPAIGWMFCVGVLTLGVSQARPMSMKPIVVFSVPWDTNTRDDLALHADAIGIYAPQWITLTSHGVLTVGGDVKTDTLLAQMAASPQLMPMVTNAHDGIWDASAAEEAIIDISARKTVSARIVALATQDRFHGIIFDLENLSSSAIAGLPEFVREVHAELLPRSFEIMIAVPLISKSWPLKALQDAGATLVVMAYDQCWVNSTPGPIAGLDWFSAALKERMQDLDPEKVVVALGSYAYDWPEGMPANVLSIDQAKHLAQDLGAAIKSDPPASNPNFTYTAADGMHHTVWMLDAETYAKEREIALTYRIRGIGLWRLGLEDPAIWTAAPRRQKLFPYSGDTNINEVCNSAYR
jgi:peptidoglycan-N-acetylglucosamine deacetylase